MSTNKILLNLTGLLFFVLPLPHTIAIRNIIFLLFLTTLIYTLINDSNIKTHYKFSKELKILFFIITALTFWILFVDIVISKEIFWSLKETKGQWISSLVYFFTFIFAASYFKTNNPLIKKIFLYIFIALLLQVLYVDLYSLQHYIDYKVFPTRVSGLEESPDKSNYITNMLISFVISEIIYRIRVRKKIINIDNFPLFSILALAIISSILEGMRNGAIAIFFLGITSTVFILYKNNIFSKTFKISIIFFLMFSLMIPALYNLKYDKRWNTLLQTIPIALDTKTYKSWISTKKYPLPKLPNGETVNVSNYQRIAWAYEGLKIIFEHPIGIGFGRNSFGHGIQHKYHLKKQIGHSHSGLIDLTIGIGIPGLILWLSLGGYLLYLSLKYFRKYNSFFALILFFNTSGFYIRSIVDSNIRDHMLIMFFIITALSLVFMTNEKTNNYKS